MGGKAEDAAELQKYTAGISEVQKERLNNAIYQISDEEILALSEGYYSNEVGVLEEPQMNLRTIKHIGGGTMENMRIP